MAKEEEMAAHLTASELASLIGCKANQRVVMPRWLDKQDGAGSKGSTVCLVSPAPSTTRKWESAMVKAPSSQRGRTSKRSVLWEGTGIDRLYKRIGSRKVSFIYKHV